MFEIAKVTVLGTGVLGSQIAYHVAFSGFDVVAHDISDDAIEQAKKRITGLVATYKGQVKDASDGPADDALDWISYSTDLAAAAADADLIIEAIPEKLDLKLETYRRLGELAPAHTIFATNSSTLLPSDLMEATGRPDRFLALHFSAHVWLNNTAEVMGSAQTDPEVYRTIVRFASDTGMVPIEVKKEKSGYVLNSLLVPFLAGAGELLMGGYADPETVDKTWRIGTGSPLGPFQIFDIVGLGTVYNISVTGDEKQREFAKYLDENFIQQGKLGISSGQGFYKYPKR